LTDRIYLSAPKMGEAELAGMASAIAADEIAMGTAIAEFEARLAVHAGTKGAVAAASGTAAIHLALDVLGIGSGDIVFCSSLTFAASAAPVRYLGAEPVFIDSEPESWNMSPDALKRAFETHPNPKAVIIVDLYGQAADYDALSEICTTHDVPIVEDAAEALGATYKDRPAGGFGKIGIYSFNGNKILTTGGGGALLSDDETLLTRARNLAAQAREPALHYEHTRLGYNYRISNLAAAAGNAQLDRLMDRITQRREVFERYRAALSDIEAIGFMPEAPFGTATRWLTVMTMESGAGLPTPAALCEALEAENIEARPVWKPMHRQPVFTDCAYFTHGDNQSVSDDAFASGVCLPSGPDVTEDRQNRVIAAIRKALGKG